jgi:hypothetical protein
MGIKNRQAIAADRWEWKKTVLEAIFFSFLVVKGPAADATEAPQP